MTTISGTFKLTINDATVISALDHWFREKSPGLLADNQTITSIERIKDNYGPSEFLVSVATSEQTKP